MRLLNFSSAPIGCTLAILTLLLSACTPSEPTIPVEDFPVDPDLPAAVVDLPSPPPASAFEIREFNDDGSLRVEGVMGNRDRYLDEAVEIRGIISEVEGDCDPGVAQRRGEFCPEPHLFIRDHSDDDRRLMVVGYTNDFRRRARLNIGEEYLFAGTYKQMAAGFVSTEDGLLVVSAVDEREVSN